MNQPRLGGAIPSWEIEDRLTKARSFARMNQRQLAEALGVSERTIKRYESGASHKRHVLLAWAFACGVSPTWLEYGGDIDPDGGMPDTRAHNLRYVRRLDFACGGNVLVAA